MNMLVTLYNGKEPRVSTFLIFEKFGYSEHRTFKNLVLKNKEKFETRGELINVSTDTTIKKRGRPDEGYFLNERQFMFLVMLAKNTKESIELKERIENEFNTMRLQLTNLAKTKLSTNWQQARKDGIEVYKQKRDVIKDFIGYATEQGASSGINNMYATLATMENKALFLLEQKFKNMREVANIRQLQQLSVADQIIEKALQDGMEQKLHYKEIYQLAKQRVIQFSEIIGKSQVIAMLEQDKQLSLE